MQRCLMLDVDGVLINGRPEDGRSWATDIERDLGIAPDRLVSVFFAPHWDDIVTGRKALPEVLEACLPDLTPTVSAPAFIDYWFAKDSAVDQRVLADCRALRRTGTRVFLATNQEHLRSEFLMTDLALRDHVEGIVYSARVGARKPDRAFFDAAVKHSGAWPEDTLLVDDTKANVEAARDAGWGAIQWSEGACLRDLFKAWSTA